MEIASSSPMLQPRNPDFVERVESSFAAQTAMHSLGITLEDVKPGYAKLAMQFDGRFAQQHGFVHAGIVTTALDSACGYAAFSLMEAQAEVLTVEFKTNLLAPARGEAFIFEGRILKPGRTLTVCEGKAYAISEEGPKLIASMNATMIAVYDRVQPVNEVGQRQSNE